MHSDMLFVVALGLVLGGAAVTLLRQWASEALAVEDENAALTSAGFPHLAPPTRQPRFPAGYAPSPYLAALARRRRAA